MTETERFVVEALTQLSMGNDGDATYHPLFKAWRSYRYDPEQLNQIEDYARYGMGLMIFLSYGTVSDIDDHQQLASLSYMYISKAIKTNPSVNHLKNRLILMITNHEAFEYTVSSVVNKDSDFMFMSFSPYDARDAMFKMEFADLSSNSALLGIGMLNSKFIDLRNKISSDFFGPNKTETTIINEGKKLHDEILEYLENKILKNGDIDF